jgi:TetR/AcrR family transcriptional regulator, cholesterol catabolism regulator
MAHRMATAAKKTGRNAAEKRRRRGEVLDVAARMFAEKGYENTTSQDIGKELGMLRGSIYYYFDSKEGLLFELIEEVWLGALEYLDEVLASDASPAEKLHELIRRHVLYITENTTDASLFLHEVRSLSDKHRATVIEQEKRYRQGITKLIKDGQAKGEIRKDIDAKLATFQVLGAVNWPYRWYQKGKGASAKKVADQFADTLLGGLRAKR